jgi:hypothetical protein
MIVCRALPGVKQFFPPASCRPAIWLLVERLMTAFLRHRGKMSLSQAAAALPAESRHRANLSRSLARAACLTSAGSWNRVQRRMIDAERRKRGRWVFIVDQTYCGQQGRQTENTFSRANYRPRPHASERRQKQGARRSCHGFVCGLLISPGGCRIPCFRSYYTRAYCAAYGLPYRTQTELAAELIRQLPLPAKVDLTVLGDTAFDAAVIRDACRARGAHWIVPVNPERVLEGPSPRPKVRSLGKRLRARDFSPLRLTPGQGAWAAHCRAALCRQESRTCRRTFYVYGERRHVRRVGDVRLVFSTNQRPCSGKSPEIRKILLTDDLERSVRDVVACYDVRWQIELFFKELKTTLGFGHYRFRRFVLVERWAAVCLLTFLYLEWVRRRRLRGKRRTEKENRWWRAQRTHGLAQAVGQQIERDELRWVLKSTATVGGVRRLRRLLRQSVPQEYRLPA